MKYLLSFSYIQKLLIDEIKQKDAQIELLNNKVLELSAALAKAESDIKDAQNSLSGMLFS
jgi:hypothetical protein